MLLSTAENTDNKEVNPQRHARKSQIHTPTVVQGGGGWMEPHPRVFDMLQYFETILPLVESLWSS